MRTGRFGGESRGAGMHSLIARSSSSICNMRPSTMSRKSSSAGSEDKVAPKDVPWYKPPGAKGK